MSNIIGERIKELRIKLGLRQEDIAFKLGINRVSYSHYESGKNIPPSDKLSMIVDILFTNADYLLGKTDDPTTGMRQLYIDTDSLDIKVMSIKETNEYYNAMEKRRLVKLYNEQIQRLRDEDLINASDYHLLTHHFENALSDNCENNKESFEKIPLIGTICAGNGLMAEQNIEDYVVYPIQSKNKYPDFALRVKGLSMINAGIDDGDIVYFKKAPWADYSGQIVAAIINDISDGTLKRMKWSEGSNKIQLIPENNDFDTIEVLPNQLQICGVYMGHFKPEKFI